MADGFLSSAREDAARAEQIARGLEAAGLNVFWDNEIPPGQTWADYIEQNWSAERYSGGGMLSHAPTGVLTQFGPALREPCGLIHWAGTETAAYWTGYMDGAVSSGERVAKEVAPLV